MKTKLLAALALVPTAANAAPLAEAERSAVIQNIDKRAPALASTALAIWNYAEVGYQENRSSSLLQAELKKAGFKVEAGVAGGVEGCGLDHR